MTKTTATLSQWNALLGDAFMALGSDEFPARLETAFRCLVEFDICMVFSYSQSRGAKSLYHDTSKKMSAIFADYLAGPYMLDPFYGAILHGQREGFVDMRSLAPDHFYRSEFYRHHYVTTRIGDEIGLVFTLSDDETAILSVTRQKGSRRFSDRDKERFATAAPILTSMGAAHWSNQPDGAARSQGRNRVEAAFAEFGVNVLTAREREVVALILKGHSSLSISHVLNITEGTVKIHRKNVYERLDISSQAQLFSLFLDSLESALS